jgi:hypothetical protein
MIVLNILQASYWEHFKFAKELALYLPVSDKKRVELEIEMNRNLIKEIHILQNKNK